MAADVTHSLPQQAQPAFQGKVAFPENACIVLGKTEEVVLLGESAQTVDTAGRTTSSDPALRPAHLPLNRSLRSLGKAFGCGNRHSCSLFPRLLDKSESHRQLPYSLPLHPSRRGWIGGQGWHGFGGHGRGGRGGSQGRQSRFTHTTRFPQSSTPSSTSAVSPGRQGFSIVTRRQAHSSGKRPIPQRAAPNTGTRTQLS